MTEGERLYRLISEVMAKDHGPGGRASSITWEHMDGPDDESRERAAKMGLKSERESWEEIARIFRLWVDENPPF